MLNKTISSSKKYKTLHIINLFLNVILLLISIRLGTKAWPLTIISITTLIFNTLTLYDLYK